MIIFYEQGAQYALEKLGFGMRQALQASFKVVPKWYRSSQKQMRSIVNKMDDAGRTQLKNLVRESGGHELLTQRPEAVAGLRQALASRATNARKIQEGAKKTQGMARPDRRNVGTGLIGGAALGGTAGVLAAPLQTGHFSRKKNIQDFGRPVGWSTTLGADLGGAFNAVSPAGRAFSRAMPRPQQSVLKRRMAT